MTIFSLSANRHIANKKKTWRFSEPSRSLTRTKSQRIFFQGGKNCYSDSICSLFSHRVELVASGMNNIVNPISKVEQDNIMGDSVIFKLSFVSGFKSKLMASVKQEEEIHLVTASLTRGTFGHLKNFIDRRISARRLSRKSYSIQYIGKSNGVVDHVSPTWH